MLISVFKNWGLISVFKNWGRAQPLVFPDQGSGYYMDEARVHGSVLA
jgi:hypothetical protein